MTEDESTDEKKEEKEATTEGGVPPDVTVEPEIKTVETPIVQPGQPSIIPEQPPMTSEEFVHKEEPPVSEPPPEQPAPCDPTTMTCDEIKDKITIELIPDSYKYKTAVEKIEEIKKIDPSPEIDKALSVATEKMEKTNKEITDMFEKYKYAICEKPEKKPEEEKVEGP